MSTHFHNRDDKEIILLSRFLASEITWTRVSGKQTIVLSGGEVYSREEISYWFEKNISLSFEQDLNYEWLEEGARLLEKNAWLDEQSGPQETERIMWRDDFLKWVGKSLWSGDDEIKHDDVITLMMCHYFNLNEHLQESFHHFSSEVKLRNILVASYIVFFLVSAGYYHHQFLRDVFNVCLFIDYPYSQTSWSSKEKKSMMRARSNKVLTEIEKKTIMQKRDHYREIFIPEIEKGLSYKNLTSLLDLSFERLDGRGFPANVGYNGFTDVDLTLIFLVNTFSLESKYVGTSAMSFIKNMVEAEGGFLSRRIKGLIEKALVDEGGGYIKVAGL